GLPLARAAAGHTGPGLRGEGDGIGGGRPWGRGGVVARAARGVRSGVPGRGNPRVRPPAGGLMSSPERVMAKLTAGRGERILGWLTLVALVGSAIMSLEIAPPDADQRNAQRLMYVHVPSAWLADLSFGVVLVAS